ncbi:MAG: hypothetical protein ACK53V_08795, partial [Planctomycetota bacterium]
MERLADSGAAAKAVRAGLPEVDSEALAVLAAVRAAVRAAAVRVAGAVLEVVAERAAALAAEREEQVVPVEAVLAELVAQAGVVVAELALE